VNRHQILTRSLVFALAVALALPALGQGEDANKKKKKKKQSEEQQKSAEQSPADAAGDAGSGLSPAVASALERIDQRLLAWNTAEARRLVDGLSGAPEPLMAMARGRIAQQDGDWGLSQTELQRAADGAPADPAPLVHLGETQLFVDNQAGAQQSFSRAIERAQAQLARNPNDPAALYYLGVAQQRLKRYDEAAATLERLRQQQPEDALVQFQLGATRAFQERWGDAIPLLDRAIALDSGIAYAYYYRGLSEGRVGRKDLLINDLSRFLAMAPSSPDAAKARRILESV
jgi:tetratricopeptide (TPR) repeat protein